LLDLEKIQKYWKKRFNGIDIVSIAPDSFNYINPFFTKIETSNPLNFVKFEENHQISLTLDLDLLTQTNKLSLTKHIEAVRIFFNKFNIYLKNSSEPKELLSINSFSKQEGMSFSLFITYSDLNKKEAIKQVISDLVDFAISKDSTNKNLKGLSLPNKDNQEFFNSFILESHLNHSLVRKKQDVSTLRKSKI
jgi:hypothetical protein